MARPPLLGGPGAPAPAPFSGVGDDSDDDSAWPELPPAGGRAAALLASAVDDPDALAAADAGSDYSEPDDERVLRGVAPWAVARSRAGNGGGLDDEEERLRWRFQTHGVVVVEAEEEAAAEAGAGAAAAALETAPGPPLSADAIAYLAASGVERRSDVLQREAARTAALAGGDGGSASWRGDGWGPRLQRRLVGGDDGADDNVDADAIVEAAAAPALRAAVTRRGGHTRASEAVAAGGGAAAGATVRHTGDSDDGGDVDMVGVVQQQRCSDGRKAVGVELELLDSDGGSDDGEGDDDTAARRGAEAALFHDTLYDPDADADDEAWMAGRLRDGGRMQLPPTRRRPAAHSSAAAAAGGSYSPTAPSMGGGGSYSPTAPSMGGGGDAVAGASAASAAAPAPAQVRSGRAPTDRGGPAVATIHHGRRPSLVPEAPSTPPPPTDAVLSCPCCFAIVCYACTRHAVYHTQFRAPPGRATEAWVRVDRSSALEAGPAMRKASAPHREAAAAVAPAATPAGADGTGGGASSSGSCSYYLVSCRGCGTVVGLQEAEAAGAVAGGGGGREVDGGAADDALGGWFHFFHALPGEG